LNLLTAGRYAEKIRDWLAPYAVQLKIVGSIRRQRDWCNDVDIVCIPLVTEHADMFGNVISRTNHCLQYLQRYVAGKRAAGCAQTRFLSGGETEGKQVLLQLPKCQLDLWFADHDTWTTRVICRTGSKEHNIWLAQRAKDRGCHWNPYSGLQYLGRSGEHNLDNPPTRTATEEAFYKVLGLPEIAPENRESTWLEKNIL
jgi:DNA polymerase/3'-5' exonuclease PolX